MRTWSPTDILERNIEVYPFTGDWSKLLGEPDIRFSSLIRGRAKSGKSTYSMKFAQHVAQWGRGAKVQIWAHLAPKTSIQQQFIINMKSYETIL